MPILICKKCNKDCTLYRGTSPRAKEIWAMVEKCAAKAPPSVVARIKKLEEESKDVDYFCNECVPYQW